MSDEHGFRAPAEAYDRHIGRYGPELARELVAAAGVRPGDRVLDVGCGPGALTGELVAIAGQPQLVAAVDPSPPFAAACAERLPGTDVRTGAAEALPFPDGAFDAALAQLVVNFMDDATAGVREMARVVRPGGAVGLAVWDYAHGMTLLRRFWDAAEALDPAAAERDEGRTMRYCSPGELTQLLDGRRADGGRRRRRDRHRLVRRPRRPLGAARAGRRPVRRVRGRAPAGRARRAPGGALPPARGDRRAVHARRAGVRGDGPRRAVACAASELHRSGALTDAEFAAAKAKLLGS